MAKTKSQTKKGKVDFSPLFTEENLKLDKILELKDKICKDLKTWREFEKAVEDLEDESPTKLSESKGLTRKGVMCWILNRTDNAINILEQAWTSQEASFFLALAYLDKGFYYKAHELLEDLYKDAPDTLCIIIPYVEAKIKIGQVEEALPILEKSYKRYRNEPDLTYYTGLCYEYLGNYKRAETEYQHTLRLNPNHSRTLFRLAYRLDLEGKDEEALSLYEKLYQARPTYVNALINLGLLYEDQAKYDESIRCYKTVLDYNPNHPRARLYLRDALSAQKMYYDEETKRQELQLRRAMSTPLTDFSLSVRSRAAMEELGLKTVGDLSKKTEQELLACENFGMTSLNELKEILARKGLSLTPEKVSVKAASPLTKPGELEGPISPTDLLNKPLANFDWAARTRQCFERLKIYTIGDLTAKSEQELLKIRNFGQTSLKEIKRRLASFNLTLRVEV